MSRATVSYVLNDVPHQSIPDSTRKRVLDAAAKLDYVPSPAARALAAGRTDLVLGLVPDWVPGQNVSIVLKRLTARFAERGLTFLSHTANGQEPDLTHLWQTISPAAVLAFDDISENQVSRMRAAGIPVTVAVWSRSGRLDREVDMWDERVGRMQVEHLVAAGHSRLGYAWPEDERLHTFANPRLAGVRAACHQLGVREPDVQTVSATLPAATDAIRRWTERSDPITALVAFNDDLALAALAGMRSLGLRAPQDIAVIGVDDVAAATFSDPPLTTLAYDHEAMAETLAQTVVDAMSGKSTAHRNAVSTIHLVLRDSA